jgi:hypothetical protein
MHHYFVAAFLIPWTCFFNPISAVLQALLAGIFTEGQSHLLRPESIPNSKPCVVCVVLLAWAEQE